MRGQNPNWSFNSITLAFVIVSTLVITIACQSAVVTGQQSIEEQFALVTETIDGDTIVLDSGERVRYIGIDTPELHHPENGEECFAPEATERNRELVEGRKVRLLADGDDRDQYGRLLRYVFVDGTFVNGQLVWEGFAYSRSFGEQKRLQQTIVQLERSARGASRGIWAECTEQD